MVTTQRDAKEIRAEIEQARDQLAGTVDQLVVRLSPRRLADQAKAALKAKATSPRGKAVLGGGAVLLTLLAIHNVRRSRRG